MPPSPTLIARDQRILAGYRAGATILDLALAEEVDPGVVRRVLRAAGIEPGPTRRAPPPHIPDCLNDPDWLRAEYATKGARLGRAEGRIAKELGCSHDRVYEVFACCRHSSAAKRRPRGAKSEISPDQAERAVSLDLAGWSVERIGEELGVSLKRLGELLEERGVKRTRSEVARVAHAPAGTAALGPSEWPTELQAEVLERYARGQSGEVISELLELPASSVYRLLREQGVLRPRGAVKRIGERGRPQVEEAPGVTEILPADLMEQAVARYQAGESPRVIGLALGVSAARVYQVLKQCGVVRSKSEARMMAHARRRVAGERDPANVGPTEAEAEVVEQ